MTYSDIDISIFSKRIHGNDLSVADAIEWAYAQYTDDGAEPWIEELALANDKEELLEILRKNFNVSDNLSAAVTALGIVTISEHLFSSRYL